MKLLAFVAAVATIGFAVQAQATVLNCTMAMTAGGGGWITNLYVFEYDEKAGKARVIDGVIDRFVGEPIPAKMSESTAKKLVFSWNVQMTNGSGQQTKMQYRAAIIKGDKSITVRATPGGGYDNSFEDRGKCK